MARVPPRSSRASGDTELVAGGRAKTSARTASVSVSLEVSGCAESAARHLLEEAEVLIRASEVSEADLLDRWRADRERLAKLSGG